MNRVQGCDLPTAKNRFKPRLEEHILSALVQEANTAKTAEMMAKADELNVYEIVTSHMETIYPAADMAILRKYGVAAAIKDVTILAWNDLTQRWDKRFTIPLSREVMTSGSFGNHDLYSGGVRYSKCPDRGVSSDYRTNMKNEEWLAFCADQDAREARRLPESTEAFFDLLVDTSNRGTKDYRTIVRWPGEVRAATGKYPTWDEIERQFPLFGSYVARRRVEIAAELAERQKGAKAEKQVERRTRHVVDNGHAQAA